VQHVKAKRVCPASHRVSECNIVNRTLLFDLDGTLVDSVTDLSAALNRLMQSRALSEFSDSETATMVGDGTAALIERAFAARARTPDPAALTEFLADYGANAAVATRLYPGVAATLRTLVAGGWRLAVCTNKPEVPARALLRALGVGQMFAAVGGGDSFPVRKPDPAHLLATLAAAGGCRQRAVMAGDHANDVAAARGAGVPCIFAAWGYGPIAMAAGAAAIAHDFTELPAIAGRLVGDGARISLANGPSPRSAD
jgi:phosphoglycolate phosphatase